MKNNAHYESIQNRSEIPYLAFKDSLNVISGKWKGSIIAALLIGNKRFSDLSKYIPKINPAMLSRELKELEMNGILVRMEINQSRWQVEYVLTQSGLEFCVILDAMVSWGIEHRGVSMGYNNSSYRCLVDL